MELLLTELRNRSHLFEDRTLSSLYFGGGTPSLFPAENILTISREIANLGFQFTEDTEVTLEINPGTIDDQRLDLYRAAGVNRFSLGVQSLNNSHLKKCGREHSAEETRADLEFFRKHGLNFTLDLLFGLPDQDLNQLDWEVDQILAYQPPHLSAYNLTLPKEHFLNRGRASLEEQAEMFDFLDERLSKVGLFRYELSNFSRPGYESRHNLLYWNDQDYWGLGVSAHSYLKTSNNPLGIRFWNSTNSRTYEEQVNLPMVPNEQTEKLKLNEALTDYCHTQLRKVKGLEWGPTQKKFSDSICNLLTERAKSAERKGLLEIHRDGFRLTPKGRQLANPSFLNFTFFPEELSS